MMALIKNLFGEEVEAPEDRQRQATKQQFLDRFKAHMIKRAGFDVFDDGRPVADYADEIAGTYWDDAGQRADGPEECADADMSYWGE